MSLLEDLKLQFKIGDVLTKLIFWNIAFFAIPSVVLGILPLFKVNIDYLNYVSLSTNPNDLLLKPWSIFSYAFCHSSILHILFNLIMLNFAGRLFLIFFNPKQLLSLYFVGSLFAGFVFLLSYMFFPALANINTALVGASASVMAILFATVTYSPLMNIKLLLFGNVKLWHIALVLIVIDLFQLPRENTGGHLAHIGGAFFGYIYIRLLKNGTDICNWFTLIIDAFSSIFGSRKSKPFKKVHRTYKAPAEKRASKIVTKDKVQQQIDEILDKISQSGYDSLSSEEKEFLFKAGKQ
ncbi:MAG: rhomboid family intramembrane serine protease [Flavobacterium sp.]|nr:rhomboid family intramembrane serine protease [Flavobacterium sp.]